jgi:hypothetical protein
MYYINTIRAVDIKSADMATYKKHLGDCVVITHDGKILMQHGRLAGVALVVT